MPKPQQSKPTINLITSCSSTRVVPPLVSIGNMPPNQSMQSAMGWWVQELTRHKDDTVLPREQYRGLGFSTLTKILDNPAFDFRSFIVTGGQGLIGLDEPIVPYDFTAGKNEEHNVWQKVTAEPFVQTLWWSGINDNRGKGTHPVASLIDMSPGVFTLIACPKVFLRYIAEDVLSAKHLQNVRILLASSSVTSVPMQLRPLIVPYDRECIAHIPGNRNDNNYRAARLFLDIATEDPNFLQQDKTIQAKHFTNTSPRSASRVSSDAIKKAFENHPEYLLLSEDEAYSLVRREHGPLGGRMLFRGLYRLAKGTTVLQASEDEQDAANKAFLSLGLTETTSNGGGSEELALKGIGMFVGAVRQLTPNVSFTSADIARWALNYYGEEKLPDLLSSSNKLSYLLKANTELLGLESLQEGKQYKIKAEILEG